MSVIALIQQVGPALDTSVAWFYQEYHLCHFYPKAKTNPASSAWPMSVYAAGVAFLGPDVHDLPTLRLALWHISV